MIAQRVLQITTANRLICAIANPALQRVAQTALLQLPKQAANVAAILLHQLRN